MDIVAGNRLFIFHWYFFYCIPQSMEMDIIIGLMGLVASWPMPLSLK